MSRAASNGYRNASNGSNPSFPPNGPAMNQHTLPYNAGAQATVSRAERFEDEKRRIIESCFSRHDDNGQVSESYITHIRVQEDAQSPSAPPPPDGSTEGKKPRLIIIAVRSTGRVRVHKARENNNGSFSIGKTWNMEELSVIEAFSSSQPAQSEREAQQRSWAGSTGFRVTLTKPYYWQAGTSKEKDFFIASAVKIYRKYTNGQVPELRGFDDQQRALILGAQPTPPQQQPRSFSGGARVPSGPGVNDLPAPPQPPFAARPQSRENSRYRESPGPPPSLSDRDRPSSAGGSRAGSEGRSPARFQESSPAGTRPFAASDQLRAQGSREGLRYDARPSTSSGPGGYRSSPSPSVQTPPQSTQAASQIAPPPPLSQARTHSPAASSIQSGRDRPLSPLRNENGRQEQEASMASLNGATGAELFANSRQRLAVHQQQPNNMPSSTSVTYMPSAERPKPVHSLSDRPASPPANRDTTSQAGEPLKAGDAAVAAVASASILESSSDLASPPTPERSRHRQPLDVRVDEPGSDLRPRPLNAKGRALDATDPVVSREVTSTPQSEESPSVRPLAPSRNRSDVTLAMPGAFAATPRGTSPASISAEAPGEASRTVSSDAALAQSREEEEEQFRPGLGPMIKKKQVADRFKKAATAANAFKPKPGGAAEKILRLKAEREANEALAEPNGTAAALPQPLATSDSQVLAANDSVSTEAPRLNIVAPLSRLDGAPQPVELRDEPPRSVATPEQQPQEPDAAERDLAAQRSLRQQQLKIKRRSAQHLRYLEEMGVDSSLLADKSVKFEAMLYDFGWAQAQLSPKALTNMEADLRREQARLEAGSWLPSLNHDNLSLKDDKERQVIALLDQAIQECDEMDSLLTIYHVELNSLNDDVAYIEAQSQGLQVQSANQQLLHTELGSLLQTVGLDKRGMEPLRRADLGSTDGLEQAEGALVKVYQAMITIDPTLRSGGKRKSRGVMNESNELASMYALRQKREVYERESQAFCHRLVQHLDQTISQLLSDAKGRAMETVGSGTKLRKETWTEARQPLWMYSPLVLYAKELDPPAWQTLLKTYQARAKPLYADVFGRNFASWKRVARKSTGEESEILFTAQEKDEPSSGSALSSARKLTVKRSHTLAKTLRHASGGDKYGPAHTRSSGSLMTSEAFAASVDEMAVLISQEQNFVVDFFHASSLEEGDFVDVVSALRPSERHEPNLQAPKPTEPDREVARRVSEVMDEIFGFFSLEVSSFLDWAIVNDPVQGIGVLACLSRHAFYLQDSSQDYLIQLVEQLMARLHNLFTKFVQEQVRAIEETKVKIKKRKGVIAFMKIFPPFSAAVENVFSAVAGSDYDSEAACVAETRRAVDEAYAKINRAMFDSLKVIAKESPTAVPQSAAAAKAAADDPEDKEMLNYHILLIENMNHYIEEVDDGGKEGVLAEWKGKALMERAEAMDAYIGRVIRRPLGKLLDFLDSLDAVKEAHPHNPAAITARPTYSRKAARGVLAAFDAREVRRGIDTLRKRVEKHFGDADDEPISRALVGAVCRECERAYERAIARCEDAIRDLYPPVEGEKAVELEFSRADVQAGFRR